MISSFHDLEIKGNYLAEDAGKCDQYVLGDGAFGSQPELHKRLYRNSADHPGRVYYMLVCRTTMGAYLRTVNFKGSGCVSLDNPPVKVFPVNERELANIRDLTPPAPHHGLVIETSGGFRFREFIVFHGEYAYPEYLLAFKRA